MFVKITNPTINAYDNETGQYLGEARFRLTQEAEEKLLNWINYGTPITSLVIVNSDFTPSPVYVPIIPNQTYRQKGVFRAILTNGQTGVQVPVEAILTFDWRSRSVDPETFIRSAEYSNIKLESMREVGY